MSWQDNVNDDYEKLFETDEGYDVIIYAALSDKWAKKKDGKFILEKPNISPNIFKIILRFIYCGKIDITKLEVPELLKLLMAVDELSIQSLTPRIEEYLIKHQYEFLQQNPIGILETIYQNETFTSLLDYCLNKICKEPEILFNTDKFIDLKAPIIELLIKQNDLCLEEIEIWDNLLKWAFAQNPTISEDVTKWNKEEVTIMERTLHRYIPLIRFYYISSEDFHDKVFPFKEILPKDLINNLFTFYLVPNRKTNIDKQPPRRSTSKCDKYDSIIVNLQHFALFASWIDRKNDNYLRDDIPYNFNLLYRSSRDGNTIAKFHEKTDNKGANIVIAKFKNTNQIIGGYNPLDWSGQTIFRSTADSFIFSFKDYKNTDTGKIGRVIEKGYAIYCYNKYGPIFGKDNGGGCDIMLYSSGEWSSCPGSYPDIGIPRNYEIENYEVFQVVNKN
ncbi:BTB/POZ domain-containing protein [Rhizophagus irregularis DAOM 181602=DAOM 197198]|nr:BTB/POZ domain-containing protein [Rhizophagus irregularis DAOM 181602=DAOM 197198]